MNIEALENKCLKPILYSVYGNDLCGDTLQDLLSNMVAYINETIHQTNDNTKLVQGLYDYVKNEGLKQEVINEIRKMVDDGTFDQIINQQLFGDLSGDVEALKAKDIAIEGNVETNKQGIANLSNEVNIIKKQTINIKYFINEGGVPYDESYDNSKPLNRLISELYDNGGGSIIIPNGKFYFKDTVTMKPNVSIIGINPISKWNGNGTLWYEYGTVLFFIPDSRKDFIITDRTTTSLSYFPNLCIKNIQLVGNENSLIGLDMSNIAKSIIENVLVMRFDTNYLLSNTMSVILDNVFSQQARTTCMKVTEPICTTTNFNNCYWGQSKTSPFHINASSTLGFNFNSCTIESCGDSAYIDTDNYCYFNNLYVENTPSIGNDVPMFKIGNSETSTVNKGDITFSGGVLGGVNGNITDNMSIFDVNNISRLLVVGTSLKRARRVLKTTDKTKKNSITFISTNEIQVTNNISTNIDGEKVNYINCRAEQTEMSSPCYITQKPSSFKIQSLNGWSNYLTGCYVEKNFGFNRLNFYATCNSTEKIIIFTLPEGYRPSVPVIGQLYNASEGTFSNSKIRINTNGEVKIEDTSGLINTNIYSCNIVY